MGNQSWRVIGAFWRILAHIEPRRDSTAESPQILVAVGIPAIFHPISKAWPIRHSRTSGPALVFIHIFCRIVSEHGRQGPFSKRSANVAGEWNDETARHAHLKRPDASEKRPCHGIRHDVYKDQG